MDWRLERPPRSEKTDIFEQQDTSQSLLHMHMDFGGAQTEVSKQEH